MIIGPIADKLGIPRPDAAAAIATVAAEVERNPFERWQLLLDAGLSLWIGPGQVRGAPWAGQVKPNTGGVFEWIHGPTVSDVIDQAEAIAKANGWI